MATNSAIPCNGWVLIFWPGEDGFNIEQHPFDPSAAPDLPYKPEYPSLQFVAQITGQNVRVEHRTSSPAIAKLTRGQIISVIDIYRPTAVEEWARIRLYDGTIGWAAVQLAGTLYLKRM